MSRSLNKVQLLGHVGQDVEIKYTQSGTAVANFSMATNERWKDKATGEDREQTDWHRLVAFGSLAEIIGEYVRKGSKIFVEGKLKTRSWEDKEGVTRYTTEVVLSGPNALILLDSKGGGSFKENQQEGAYGGQFAGRPAMGMGGTIPPMDNDEDDIPF